MEKMRDITDIVRIGHVKRAGSEWSELSKRFTLDRAIDKAVIRVESEGVCGIYINGAFVEVSSGRYPERVTCVEVTGRLMEGENTLTLRLGAHYFQSIAREVRERRGAWVSWAAAELTITRGKDTLAVVTDGDWSAVSDDGPSSPVVFSCVTRLEYDRFWAHAALWRETGRLTAPDAVLRVAGEGYTEYLAQDEDRYDRPLRAVNTNMRVKEDGSAETSLSAISSLYTFDDSCLPYVIYDFGRLTVGYFEAEYETQDDGEATLEFDYTESVTDFGTDPAMAPMMKRLSVRVDMKKGRGTIRLLRRRAFRYLKITFSGQYRMTRLTDPRVLLCLAPAVQKGWFRCGDELLDKAWETGKYTLHVNKHQEYESCPRNEMKFFSGDGIVDALIDYYTFGDLELADASLSLNYSSVDTGLAYTPFNRNTGLWDYYAWRIIMAVNHYRYSGDIAFLRHYYDELVTTLHWLIERMDPYGLICQLPVYDMAFAAVSGSVEYTCSFDRLGEKTYLNALFYKSLTDMAWVASLLGDERRIEWEELAHTVRKAFNERLWNDELNACTDSFDRTVVPQDGNALAVLYGLLDDERAQKALNTLRERNWSPFGSTILDRPVDHTRGGNRTIAPAMNTYEAEARFLAGDGDGAIELIRRCWGTMLKKGAGTFWEYSPNDPEDKWPIPSHAWSGGCAYLLSAYGLGVRPLEPGYARAVFEPYAGFDSFAGVVPTAKGLIAVRCETQNGIRRYTIALPKDISLEARLPEGAVLDKIIC